MVRNHQEIGREGEMMPHAPVRTFPQRANLR
jgi:hypothetical protein